MAIESLGRRLGRLESSVLPEAAALFVWFDKPNHPSHSADEIAAAQAAGRKVVQIQWVSASGMEGGNER